MKRDAKVDRATDSGQDGDRATVGARTRVAVRYGTALAKALPDTGDQGPTIHDAATAAVEHKGGGSAVDAGVATRVGAHLGADLGGVRVHQDPLAQEASAAMGARAFAHGSDVFLGAGESGTDLGLMAHELTHVVQQGAAGQRAPQRKVEVGDAGIQMWSGFGADSVSEDAMLDEMVRAYNHARDANDTRVLGDITTRNGGTLPAQYDPASFPDQIDKAAILSAPASTIDGKVRKGGFNAGNGLALDIDKVKALQK